MKAALCCHREIFSLFNKRKSFNYFYLKFFVMLYHVLFNRPQASVCVWSLLEQNSFLQSKLKIHLKHLSITFEQRFALKVLLYLSPQEFFKASQHRIPSRAPFTCERVKTNFVIIPQKLKRTLKCLRIQHCSPNNLFYTLKLQPTQWCAALIFPTTSALSICLRPEINLSDFFNTWFGN